MEGRKRTAPSNSRLLNTGVKAPICHWQAAVNYMKLCQLLQNIQAFHPIAMVLVYGLMCQEKQEGLAKVLPIVLLE